MNVIDLFSGVGGFSTGLSQAGFNIIVANEIDEQIAFSYKKNHPKTLMINSDISEFIDNYEKLVEDNLLKQEIKRESFYESIDNVDLIVGGPPCQGFSMAGGRIRKANAFIDDPRNYLFKQYFRIIQKFEPSYFIFENVVGISSMNNGEIIQEIEKLFSLDSNFKKGKYYLQKKVFDASDYGVPQKRKRFILIGSKKPFNIEEALNEVISNSKNQLFKSKTSIEDAISDLAFENRNNYIEKQEYLINSKSYLQKKLRIKSEVIHNHIIPNHSLKTIDRIKRIGPGENWQNLKENKSIKSVHSGAYGRMCWKNQSVTVTTRFDTPSAGRFIHPTFDRNITAREAARIQTFPDKFIFLGNKTSICKQIGNAVPPLLAELLGHIIIKIHKNYDNK